MQAGRDGCFFSNLNEKDGNGNFRLLKFKHHKIAGSEETVRAKGGLSNKFAASVIFKISLKFNFCENNPALTLSCNHFFGAGNNRTMDSYKIESCEIESYFCSSPESTYRRVRMSVCG
jgi:hypothetical protein